MYEYYKMYCNLIMPEDVKVDVILIAYDHCHLSTVITKLQHSGELCHNINIILMFPHYCHNVSVIILLTLRSHSCSLILTV